MFAKSCPYGTKPLSSGAPKLLNYLSALSRAVTQAGQIVDAHLQQAEGHLVESIVENVPHYLGEQTGKGPGKEPSDPLIPAQLATQTHRLQWVCRKMLWAKKTVGLRFIFKSPNLEVLSKNRSPTVFWQGSLYRLPPTDITRDLHASTTRVPFRTHSPFSRLFAKTTNRVFFRSVQILLRCTGFYPQSTSDPI